MIRKAALKPITVKRARPGEPDLQVAPAPPAAQTLPAAPAPRPANTEPVAPIASAASQVPLVAQTLPAADVALAIGPLIGRVRTVMLSTLDGELEPFGLSAMHFGILKHLAEGTADTAADLCRLLHYDNGSMTRLLDRLEEKGLIRRERSQDDRRVVSLRLTSAGRVVLPPLWEAATRVIQGLLMGFTADEVNNLRSLLGRMIENGPPGPGK